MCVQSVLFGHWFCIQWIICFIINYAVTQQQLYNHYHPSPYYNSVASSSAQKCSRKLEDTLDSMLHRNRLKFGNGRTRIDVTPYSRYHTLYGNFGDFNSSPNEKLDLTGGSSQYQHHNSRPSTGSEEKGAAGESLRQPVDKIEVAEMRVRLPNHQKEPWVVVDRCQFNAHNRTLDTRLVFPDLTISGRVILQPSGGYCSMILRLRRAGIEFRTTPLAFGPHQSDNSGGLETGRAGPASVRTDSHFSEPGFLSVFAHGCQGPTGIKFRKNSKRNRFEYTTGHAKDDGLDNDYKHRPEPIKRSGSRHYNHHRRTDSMESNEYYSRKEYRKHSKGADDVSDDLVNFSDDFIGGNKDTPDAYSSRTFSELFSSNDDQTYHHRPQQQNWYNAELTNSNEVNDALSRELEQLFSIGVRGLLTTYMQKALQPAIKETLMENMGYVLSYG